MARTGFKNIRLSKKYLWSFFLVVLCIDLLITGALFILYSSVQVRKSTEYSVAQLKQACGATDILYRSIQATVNQSISDPDTASFLLSSEPDRLQEAGVGIKLRAWRIADPYMRFITLYNKKTSRFVSNGFAGDGSEYDMDEFYQLLGDRPYVCCLRSIGADYTVQQIKNGRAYTFVFPVQLKTDDPVHLVIIDVDDSYFNQALSPLRIPGEKQQIVLEDETGGLIAEMAAEPQQEDFTVKYANGQTETVTAGWEFSNDFGSASLREGGKTLFVAYSRAQAAGWRIYNILPYSTVLTGLGTLAALTLLLTLVTLAFGYYLSRKVSSYLYAPIQVLYENYVSSKAREDKRNELEQLSDAFSEMYSKADRLEQGLISSFEQSKNLYLMHLLSGDVEKVRSALSTYKQLNIDLSAPYYMVLIIDCLPRNDAEEDEQQEAAMFICYYALENMVRELLTPARGMEFLRIRESRFAALLNLEDPEDLENIRQKMMTVIGTMSEEFGFDTTVCVSSSTDSWEDINLIYEQTLISMDSRSAGHYGQVFRAQDEPQALSSGLYYRGMRENLADYVRSEDMAGCAAEFDRALTAMKDVSFQDAKAYCRHILMSVMDNFSPYLERDSQIFTGLLDQLTGIDSCQNVRDLRRAYLEFLDSLSRRLSAARKNGNRNAVAQAKEYIDQNYADPNLSLRVLAEQVELSPAYLGKMFASVTTYSFNDYLNLVRTTRAAELLTSTRLPISRISEEVGILNSNYFYSVFKKRYGVTPSAYRKQEKSAAGAPEPDDMPEEK